MATRSEIKEALFSELQAAVDGLDISVTRQNPTTLEHEQLPAISYDMQTRPLLINGVGTAPSRVETENGEVQAEYFHEHMEAICSLTTRGRTEDETEDMFNALRTHLQRFNHPVVAGPRDFHEDANLVQLGPNDTADEQASNPLYGDTLLLTVRFFYDIEYEDDVIEDISTDAAPN